MSSHFPPSVWKAMSERMRAILKHHDICMLLNPSRYCY